MMRYEVERMVQRRVLVEMTRARRLGNEGEQKKGDGRFGVVVVNKITFCAEGTVDTYSTGEFIYLVSTLQYQATPRIPDVNFRQVVQ